MQRLPSFYAVLSGSRFEEVLDEASNPSKDERSYLADWCEQFTVKILSGDEELRVRVVRSLVSLLPDSLGIIETWLSDPSLHEIHFTLFCYLDWVAKYPRFFDFKRATLHLVEAFLLNVRRNSGSAAWMAGDLLGDHWPPNESALVLAHVLKNARHVAGRRGAFHGVEMLLARQDLTCVSRGHVLGSLQKLTEKDRSKAFRRDVFEFLQTLKEQSC